MPMLAAGLVPVISLGLYFPAGLMFRAGSWASQMVPVICRESCTPESWLIQAGYLLMLGLFMIGLGLFYMWRFLGKSNEVFCLSIVRM